MTTHQNAVACSEQGPRYFSGISISPGWLVRDLTVNMSLRSLDPLDPLQFLTTLLDKASDKITNLIRGLYNVFSFSFIRSIYQLISQKCHVNLSPATYDNQLKSQSYRWLAANYSATVKPLRKTEWGDLNEKI